MRKLKEWFLRNKIRTAALVIVSAVLVLSIYLNIYFWVSHRKISPISIKTTQSIIEVDLTRKERKMMVDSLKENVQSYQELRKLDLNNKIPPALRFSPVISGVTNYHTSSEFRLSPEKGIEIPDRFEDVAFYPVTHLSHLIQSGKITSVQLTKLYLDRLKKYGPKLKCVVTLTEELALKQARKADDEISSGKYRGPLHGIPYGAKDLFSTKGIKTTWGAAPYKEQVPDENATVIKRLEEAGAVLVAKLSMGALAMGDVWYKGRTLNPWNLKQGSSGSSAGSAAATSSGLVGFALGTETWGSIISPSTRCRVTGLRPTFGRVSRYGAMALSWSMDKIGPICRTVEDCAVVFQAIHGPDGKDMTVVDKAFSWNPEANIHDIRVGFLKNVFQEENGSKKKYQMVIDTFESLGINLIPMELPDFPVYSLSFILNVEAAAAFDALTRSNKDDLLSRQGEGAWPNIFRQARFIPAVEYIQANRFRTKLIQDMQEKMKGIDVFVAPTFEGKTLLLTNLTGHPAVVVPTGVDKENHSTSITFIGDLYEEGKLLRVSKAFQDATQFHKDHPVLESMLNK
ncbi:MAG: amidase [Candidatus Aminicenantaceae bacterium]